MRPRKRPRHNKTTTKRLLTIDHYAQADISISDTVHSIDTSTSQCLGIDYQFDLQVQCFTVESDSFRLEYIRVMPGEGLIKSFLPRDECYTLLFRMQTSKFFRSRPNGNYGGWCGPVYAAFLPLELLKQARQVNTTVIEWYDLLNIGTEWHPNNRNQVNLLTKTIDDALIKCLNYKKFLEPSSPSSCRYIGLDRDFWLHKSDKTGDGNDLLCKEISFTVHFPTLQLTRNGAKIDVYDYYNKSPPLQTPAFFSFSCQPIQLFYDQRDNKVFSRLHITSLDIWEDGFTLPRMQKDLDVYLINDLSSIVLQFIYAI